MKTLPEFKPGAALDKFTNEDLEALFNRLDDFTVQLKGERRRIVEELAKRAVEKKPA